MWLRFCLLSIVMKLCKKQSPVWLYKHYFVIHRKERRDKVVLIISKI